MRLVMAQTIIEAQLGIPRFSGVKSVQVERTAGANKGKREWLAIRYVDGQATLPRGYRGVEDENGYVITRDLAEVGVQ